MNLISLFESNDVEDPYSAGSGDGPANSAHGVLKTIGPP